MREVMLTTEDNPYDPLDDAQFDKWYAFDTQNGYNTLSYIARVASYSDALPEEKNDEEFERAIDEIISFNLTGNYKKVVNEG
jgi:hypothetical protein